MNYTDIQFAAPIEELRKDFEAQGEPFEPHLQASFAEAYGNGGIVPREIIIGQVAKLLRRVLDEIISRKNDEGKKATGWKWVRAIVNNWRCWWNAGKVMTGKK